MYSFNIVIFVFLWYDIYCFENHKKIWVINYKFFISYLKLFKIHVCSKTIIPIFYSVIEIMHISRILNQQNTLHHFINYQLAFLNMQNYLKIT
jgi:hypothetical protein